VGETRFEFPAEPILEAAARAEKLWD
jgi:hypothetical protein